MGTRHRSEIGSLIGGVVEHRGRNLNCMNLPGKIGCSAGHNKPSLRSEKAELLALLYNLLLKIEQESN